MPKMTVITLNESTNVDWSIIKAVRELRMRRFSHPKPIIYVLRADRNGLQAALIFSAHGIPLHNWFESCRKCWRVLHFAASNCFPGMAFCYSFACDRSRMLHEKHKEKWSRIHEDITERDIHVCKGLNYFRYYIWMNVCVYNTKVCKICVKRACDVGI